MKNIFVKNIKAGDKLKEVFLIAEKSLAHSHKGLPYLNIRLKDRTGEISAKVWDKALEMDAVCQRGDLARITCWASTYKGAMQLTITDVSAIAADEADAADFFPTVKGDIEEMFAQVMNFIENVQDEFLRRLLNEFFQNEEIARRFKKNPAAKGMHHTAIGGLLEHTLAVTRALDSIAALYPNLRRDVLITGGILHDIGKIEELSCSGLAEYTTEGRLIGHIVIGLEMLNKKIALIDEFPRVLATELRHIMLSHHGEFEFGSPKRPKTKEALIIHQIDDMDAKLSAFEEHIEDSVGDGEWTGYHRLLERYIYKGGE